MPRISEFRGIVIYMYWNEGDHMTPHFHAHHGDERASVSLEGQVLAGSLGATALRLVREWAALHGQELVANWDHARRLEPMAPIEGLA